MILFVELFYFAAKLKIACATPLLFWYLEWLRIWNAVCETCLTVVRQTTQRRPVMKLHGTAYKVFGEVGSTSQTVASLKLSAVWGFRDAQIFQGSTGNFKFLDARLVTRRTFFHIEDQRILDITVQNLVSRTTWRPGFLQPCDGYFWTLLPWEIPTLKDSHGFRADDKDFMIRSYFFL